MKAFMSSRAQAGVPAASPAHATETSVVRLPSQRETLTPWLMVVLVVVLFAGGLSGYDQGVIFGALQGIRTNFGLSVPMVHLVTSGVTLGALLGSLAGGALGDRIGRKRTVLIAGALFALGAIVQWLTPDVPVLVAGQLTIGLGVGMAAVSAPIYAAELAPAHLRGRFVSGCQLSITAGIFLAYLVDGGLSGRSASRVMLGAAALPGLALFLVALVAPESPRWLLMRHRRADATVEMRKIQPSLKAAPRLDIIERGLRQDAGQASWAVVFHREWRRPLMIGVGLAVFQQITGISAIIYHANQIFASAGFVTEASRTVVATWAIGGVNVLATLIAIGFIDRLGRRKLLLAGLPGMAISLVVVGGACHFLAQGGPVAAAGPSAAGIVTVAALIGFVVCFAFSLGPVAWTVINEIFPAPIRGRSVAIATAASWGSAFVVSRCFPSLVGAIGSSMTFWLFAAFCAIGWIWIYYRMPETSGRSLEQIQQLWKDQP